jgi:hypothetical protein
MTETLPIKYVKSCRDSGIFDAYMAFSNSGYSYWDSVNWDSVNWDPVTMDSVTM